MNVLINLLFHLILATTIQSFLTYSNLVKSEYVRMYKDVELVQVTEQNTVCINCAETQCDKNHVQQNFLGDTSILSEKPHDTNGDKKLEM